MEYHVTPIAMRVKLRRAFMRRGGEVGQECGICWSQIGRVSPASAAMVILNMKAMPTRVTGQAVLRKESLSLNV